MTRPTDSEVAAALDVLRRATGEAKEYSAAEIAKMSDEDLDRHGIGPEEMLKAAAKAGDPIPAAER